MQLETPRYGDGRSTIEGTRAELEMIRDLCAAALAAGENSPIEAERLVGFFEGADGQSREIRVRLQVRMEREKGATSCG